MANILSIMGKTADDKLVIGGIFPYMNQEGIPLDIIRQELEQHNCIVAAVEHGWLNKTIRRTLKDAGYPEDVVMRVIGE